MHTHISQNVGNEKLKNFKSPPAKNANLVRDL